MATVSTTIYKRQHELGGAGGSPAWMSNLLRQLAILTLIVFTACAPCMAQLIPDSDDDKSGGPNNPQGLKGSPAIVPDGGAPKQTKQSAPPKTVPPKTSVTGKQANVSSCPPVSSGPVTGKQANPTPNAATGGLPTGKQANAAPTEATGGQPTSKQANAAPGPATGGEPTGKRANASSRPPVRGSSTGKQANAAKLPPGKAAQTAKAGVSAHSKTGLSSEEQAFLNGGTGASSSPQQMQMQQQQLNRGIRGANVSHFPWLAHPANSSGYIRVAPNAKFMKTKTGQYITASASKLKSKKASSSTGTAHKRHSPSTTVARSRRYVPTLTYDQVPVPPRHP